MQSAGPWFSPEETREEIATCPRPNNAARRRGYRSKGSFCLSESLSGLWRAFKQGGTWRRVGKSQAKKLKFRHRAYKGTLRLERLGNAIRYVLRDDDESGMIVGAFFGHTTRHAAGAIDSLNLRPS
jgi:hypothetical protein